MRQHVECCYDEMLEVGTVQDIVQRIVSLSHVRTHTLKQLSNCLILSRYSKSQLNQN